MSPRNKNPLTKPQIKALRLYADGMAHNEKALRIHETIYRGLVDKGMIRRKYMLQSAITEEGVAALAKIDGAGK